MHAKSIWNWKNCALNILQEFEKSVLNSSEWNFLDLFFASCFFSRNIWYLYRWHFGLIIHSWMTQRRVVFTMKNFFLHIFLLMKKFGFRFNRLIKMLTPKWFDWSIKSEMVPKSAAQSREYSCEYSYAAFDLHFYSEWF